MKKIAALLVGFASVAMWTMPASADEPVVRRRAAPVAAAPAAAPAQTTNWTGGQMGSSNGVSSVNNNFVEPGSYNCYLLIGFGGCSETPFAVPDSRTGFLTGLYLGYRWQMGMWVVGVEGDVNYKFNSTTTNYQNTPPPFLLFEEFYGTAKQTWDASARGRLGYLVSPTTLLYATGGVAFGEVKGTYSYRGCEDVTFVGSLGCVSGAGSFSTTRVGYTVGGGVEAAISYGWKARVEYRYTDLGNFSANIPLYNNYGAPPSVVCGGLCGNNARIDLHPTNQRITFGLGFDF
jgi:outer membrane immunogenic protein